MPYKSAKAKKEYQKEYRNRPEVKARKKAYMEMYAKEYEQSPKRIERRKTPKHRASVLVASAKKRCKTKGGCVSVTPAWVLYRLNAGVCQLTGLPFNFDFSDGTATNPYAPSLDRIDQNNRDYSESNTRVVLLAVNKAINEYGIDTMRPIFKALAKL